MRNRHTFGLIAAVTGFVAAFLVTAVTIGAIPGSGQGGAAVATAATDGVNQSVQRVDMLSEAERLTGIKVKTPAELPLSFDTEQILLVELDFADGRPREVCQIWEDISDPRKTDFLELDQIPFVNGQPAIKGLIGGEPTTIRGVVGQRVFYPAENGRTREKVAYYWVEGSFAYSLVASVDGVLSEEAVRQIVESIPSE